MQEVGYTLANEEKTWPRTQSLADFARRNCRTVAGDIVSHYFDMLWPRFFELKERVHDVVLSAQIELSRFYTKTLEYQYSLKTGDDFVR